MKKSRFLIILFIALALSVSSCGFSKKADNKVAVKSGHQEEDGHSHEHSGENEKPHEHSEGHEHGDEDEHGHEHDSDATKAGVKGIVSEPVTVGESFETVNAPGNVMPSIDSYYKMTSGTSGKILKIFVGAGDQVAQGDLLCEIASPELLSYQADYKKAINTVSESTNIMNAENFKIQAGGVSLERFQAAKDRLLEVEKSYSKAKADYETAKSEEKQCSIRLTRAKDLYADGIMSRQDYESAVNEYARDSANLRSTKTSMKKAQEQEKIAIDVYNREKGFFKNGFADKTAYQSAKTNLENSITERDSKSRQIALLGGNLNSVDGIIKLSSPITGKISELNFANGQTVDGTDVIMAVSDSSSVLVSAKVYGKDISRVKIGQRVEIRSDFTGNAFYEGVVIAVGDTMDSSTSAFEVRISIKNPPASFKSGTFVNASIVTQKRSGAILVPTQAVLDEQGKKVVFLKANTKEGYEKITVTLGSLNGNFVEVKSGLHNGDNIVTQGQSQLKSSFGATDLKSGDGHNH